MKYVDVVLSAAISVYTKGWNAIALLEKKKKKKLDLNLKRAEMRINVETRQKRI